MLPAGGRYVDTPVPPLDICSRCCRNWEGFGSDPYLQGVGAYETILGIQSQGVIATAKHFIANEQGPIIPSQPIPVPL